MNHTMLKHHVIFFVLFISSIASTAQTINKLSGSISDQTTKEILPYCSISISGSNLGTISNEAGYFEILIPDSLMNQSILFSYLGYFSFETPLKEIVGKAAKITLKPAEIRIKEVYVHPLTPEDIIKKALQRRSQNYYSNPFVTEGFYREMLTENNKYIEFIEAFIKGYHYAQNDTSKPEVQLVQGRTREDLKELQFMRREMEKKQKKAEKKGRAKRQAAFG